MKEIIGVSLMLISALLGSFGALYLKKASATVSFNIMQLLKNRFLIIGVLTYAFCTIIAIPAYVLAELSLLYPFVATGYVWTCILSIYYLKEKMNAWKWSGIVFIIIGVSLIGIGY